MTYVPRCQLAVSHPVKYLSYHGDKTLLVFASW